MRLWLAAVLALAACKKEEPAPGPTPAPSPAPTPTPSPTPVAADAAPAPVASSVVLFEAIDVNVAPKGEPFRYQVALVPKACWDAAKKAFAVGQACLDLAPEGAKVAQLEAPAVVGTLGGAFPVSPYQGVGARVVAEHISRGAVWPVEAYDAVVGSAMVKPLEGLGYEERLALARKLGIPGEASLDLAEVALDGGSGTDKLLDIKVDHDRDAEDNLNSIGTSALYLASATDPTGWTPLFTSRTDVLWPAFLDLDRNGRAEIWLELESEKDGSRSDVLLRLDAGKPLELGRFAHPRGPY